MIKSCYPASELEKYSGALSFGKSSLPRSGLCRIESIYTSGDLDAGLVPVMQQAAVAVRV